MIDAALSLLPKALKMAKKGGIQRLRKELQLFQKEPAPYIQVRFPSAHLCARSIHVGPMLWGQGLRRAWRTRLSEERFICLLQC